MTWIPEPLSLTHLGDPDILHGPLSPGDIDPVRRSQDQQPRRINLRPRLGDVSDNRPVFLEQLSKGLSLGVGYSFEHHVQGALGRSDRSHAVVNSTRSESALDDLARDD